MARRPSHPPSSKREGRRADLQLLLPFPPPYVRLWFRVEAWASTLGEEFGFEPVDVPSPKSRRVERRRTSAVVDLLDDDEAARLGIELADLIRIVQGPDQHVGGRRRVVIRLFTWVVDQAAGVLFDSQWITSGEAMSAKSASAAHARYARAYADAVSKGIESRRLVVTAIEVLWWTAGNASAYV